MEIPSEIKDRIFFAADQLLQETGRVPTVALVRSKAGVDMNYASVAMREWKRTSAGTQPTPSILNLPEGIQTAHAAGLAKLWAAAQELANQGIRSLQAAWDADKAESETIRRELSAAFETVRQQHEEAQRHLDSQARDLSQLGLRISDLTQQALLAEARATESTRRADEATQQLSNLQRDSKAEIDEARSQAAEAREEAAKLKGKLESTVAQLSEAMERLVNSKAQGGGRAR